MTGEAYFLYHSIGQYPGKAEAMAAALAEFARGWSACDDGPWGRALALRGRFLDAWAAVIGAPRETLASFENVTTALSSLIGSLPPERLRGRRVLIAADCFPSLHFLLSGLAGPMGFALHTVPARPGAAWVEAEDMVAAWGPDVGLALLTWVSSTSSHRIDPAPLIAHGRAMGSLIGIDITQGVGIIPFRLSDHPADFVIGSSLKWLCGGPGAAVLQVDPALIGQCRPRLRGWFSQPDPFSWDLDAFRYAPDSRRFGHGTPGVVAEVASLPALERWLGQDPAARLAHNRELSARLIAGADRLGLPLVSPRAESRRGGSVMLRVADGAAAVARLRAAGAWADARGQVLRLSPGEMTTAAGVERALAALG